MSLTETALIRAGVNVLCDSPRASDIDWDEVRARFARAGRQPALERYLTMASILLGADVPARSARPTDLLYAARCGLDLQETTLGRAQFYALKAPNRLSDARMRQLYGPGNPWRHRARHVHGLVRSRPGARRASVAPHDGAARPPAGA